MPSRRLKELIEGTVDHHASQRWPALEEVTISWRGSYGYLTGYLSEDDDDTIKLCRIQYLGDDTEWAFAIWQASSDSYTDAVLLDGHRTGHPNQALDTACTLYLASPGDQPAEPLKDLRGAALAGAAVGIAVLKLQHLCGPRQTRKTVTSGSGCCATTASGPRSPRKLSSICAQVLQPPVRRPYRGFRPGDWAAWDL